MQTKVRSEHFYVQLIEALDELDFMHFERFHWKSDAGYGYGSNASTGIKYI